MTKQNLLDICAAIQAFQVHPLDEPKYARLRELGLITSGLADLHTLCESLLHTTEVSPSVKEDLEKLLNKIPLSS